MSPQTWTHVERHCWLVPTNINAFWTLQLSAYRVSIFPLFFLSLILDLLRSLWHSLTTVKFSEASDNGVEVTASPLHKPEFLHKSLTWRRHSATLSSLLTSRESTVNRSELTSRRFFAPCPSGRKTVAITWQPRSCRSLASAWPKPGSDGTQCYWTCGTFE